MNKGKEPLFGLGIESKEMECEKTVALFWYE